MIAPNPTDGNMTLHFGNMYGLCEVQVFNSQGKEVDAFVLNLDQYKEHAYTMTECRNGLYYFVIKNKGRILTQKVMLSR